MTSPNTNNYKTMKLDLAYDTGHQEKEKLKEVGSEWDHYKSVSLGREKKIVKNYKIKEVGRKVYSIHILKSHSHSAQSKSSKENIDPKSDFND